MIFAAIDPGAVNAAIAVFNDSTPLLADNIRTANNMIDSAAFSRVLRDMRIERVVVENVHAMPKQGVSSTFRFGMGCGIIHGVTGALRLPLTLVAPYQWKAYHSLKNGDKEKARALAIHKWPDMAHHLERKKDADRAEALLIGDWYYMRTIIPSLKELA